jgi:intracellular sulfur oxidation DsrE/DsrF family protein
MNDSMITDEELNAFVDDELSPADQARVLQAMGRDDALQKRVGEIQQTRALLRHAYDRPPQPRRAALPVSSWERKMLAASALISVGIVTGWLLHSLASHVIKPSVVTASPKGVVIQVSENDPAKWQMALINAHNVRKAYGDKAVGVEIVAYGPGLKMLRSDSPVAAGLEEAKKDGVKLKACGNTMRMTRTTRDELDQGVDVVPAGVVEIMERQRDGYAYLSP